MAQVQFSGSSIDSITYLTGDQIGSPRLGTDDSQQVVWRWDSDAFGSVEPATDPDGDGAHVNVENRFAGQYADGESGLRYNWHRYYDAGKGRYVSSDPIGLSGGLNTFGYVLGDPVNFVDPEGKLIQAVAVVAAVVAVGYVIYKGIQAGMQGVKQRDKNREKQENFDKFFIRVSMIYRSKTNSVKTSMSLLRHLKKERSYMALQVT